MGVVEKTPRVLTSSELEFLTEASDKVVIAKLGEHAIEEPSKGVVHYTEKAQELFNNVFDELEEVYRRLLIT